MGNILIKLSEQISKEKFRHRPDYKKIRELQQEYDLQIEKNKISN